MATSGTATITSGTTSIEVTHTYGDDDFVVQWNAARDVGSVWITGKSSTVFTINISNVDLESDTDIAWAIVVGAQEETAPSTNYYCVLANAIEESGVSYNQLGLDSQNDFESLVTRTMLQASRLIDRFCDVPDDFFNGGATVTEYKDGKEDEGKDNYILTRKSSDYEKWRREYVLDYAPVISVTSVSENTASIGDSDSWSAITAYRLNSNTGKLIFSQASAPDEGTDNIRFIYVAGYSTVPDTIEMACEEIVANALKRAVKNLLNASYRFGSKASPIEVQVTVDLSDAEKKMLAPYKRMKMA